MGATAPTLTKLTGSTNPAYVYVAFDNDGAVRVGSGNLNLSAGSGGVSTGSFEAGGGAVLGLDGAHTLGGTPQVKGAGVVQISGTVDGTFNLNATAGTLELAGTLSGAGSRTISGTFVWSSGTITGTGTTTVAAGATLAVTNAFCNCHYLDGTTLQNNGTASMAVGTYIYFYNGATLANAGSFDLADSTAMYDADNLGNKVTNTGTVTKLTGSTNPANVNVAFDNDGTVRVGSGNLNLSLGSGSGGVSTGSFEAGGG